METDSIDGDELTGGSCTAAWDDDGKEAELLEDDVVWDEAAKEEELLQDEDEESGMKRKSEQDDGADSKRAKSDTTALLDVYMERSKHHVTPGEVKKFLNNINIKVMEVTQPDWIKCGTVRVCDEMDMKKVISLRNKKIGLHKVRFESAEDEDSTACECVVVAWQLAPETTASDLHAVFSEVKEVRVPQSSNGQNKGFAYLEFNSMEDALATIDRNEGVELHGKRLELKLYQKPSALPALSSLASNDTTVKDENKRVLFVGNMKFETTEDMLRDWFPGCSKVRILRHMADGRSKGMGFVHFNTASETLQALIEKKDTELDGRRILVQFADGERRVAEDYRKDKPRDSAQGRNFSGRGSYRGGFPQVGPFRGGPGGPGRGFPQGPGRGFPQGPGRSVPQGPVRGFPRGPGRGFPQGQGQGFSQGSGRGLLQDPSPGFQQGPSRGRGLLRLDNEVGMSGAGRGRFSDVSRGQGLGSSGFQGPNNMGPTGPNMFNSQRMGPAQNAFRSPGMGAGPASVPMDTGMMNRGPGIGEDVSVQTQFRKNLEEELEQTKRLEDAMWRRMMLENQLKKMDSGMMGGDGFGMNRGMMGGNMGM